MPQPDKDFYKDVGQKFLNIEMLSHRGKNLADVHLINGAKEIVRLLKTDLNDLCKLLNIDP